MKITHFANYDHEKMMIKRRAFWAQVWDGVGVLVVFVACLALALALMAITE